MIKSTMHRRKHFLFAGMMAVLLCSPLFAFADELSVSPVLFDEKGKQRDIIKESIHIINTSNHKLYIYPSVNNVNPQDGQQPFEQTTNGSDIVNSLANWIELSRGVIELSPAEERDIPLVIHVDQNAVPGLYHVNISLGKGNTRDEAEKVTIATVTINVEVQADIKELMQLNKFVTDNVYFSGDDILFKYQLQNIGNQDLQPSGEITVYDSKGKEVAALEVNKEGKAISPDQIGQLASVWAAANGFGKYKALLNVDYGRSQVASVQDTVFFWIIPWKQLVLLFTVCLGAIVAFAIYFHKRFERSHNARLVLAAGAAGIPLLNLPQATMPHVMTRPPEPPPVDNSPGIFARLLKIALRIGLVPFVFPLSVWKTWRSRPQKRVAPIPDAPVQHSPSPLMHRAAQSAAPTMPPRPLHPKPVTLRDTLESEHRDLHSKVIDLSDHKTHDPNKIHTTDDHVINLKDL